MNIEGYETVNEVAKRLKVDSSQIRHLLLQGRFPQAFKLTKSPNAPWIFPKGAKPTPMPEDKVEEYRAKWREKHARWRERQKKEKEKKK